MKQSKVLFVALTALAVLATGALAVAVIAAVPADYKGKPWKDKAQEIPGKVWLASFDVGGEGVAYHETTKNNQGPNDREGCRKDEAVDISYTKPGWDKWKDDGKPLTFDQLYVGWTDAGEWVNCTVDVKESGTYQVNFLASANNKGTQISLAVNGKSTDPIDIEQTGNWHTWKLHNAIAKLKLEKGLNVITLKFEKEGNQNAMWLEFVPEGAAKADAPKADAPKADAPKADAKGAVKGAVTRAIRSLLLRSPMSSKGCLRS